MGIAEALSLLVSLVLNNAGSAISVAQMIKDRMDAGQPITTDDMASAIGNDQAGKQALQDALNRAPDGG